MAMHDTITERLQLLEEKFLYQEQTIDALHEVLLEQQRQLGALEEEVKRLTSILTTLADRPPGAGRQEPPPPHY